MGVLCVIITKPCLYLSDLILYCVQERDLHSGLIGPLVICKPGTLQTRHNRQLNIQEFSLFFHTFDETKSWYLQENLQRHCAPPCQVNTEDPWYHDSNKFAGNYNGLYCHDIFVVVVCMIYALAIMSSFSIAINGYVAETLPGLLVAQHQLVRWHLLNVGSNGEYHAVHFHGLPFTLQMEQEHRMGVYNLFPGKYAQIITVCLHIYCILQMKLFTKGNIFQFSVNYESYFRC